MLLFMASLFLAPVVPVKSHHSYKRWIDVTHIHLAVPAARRLDADGGESMNVTGNVICVVI